MQPRAERLGRMLTVTTDLFVEQERTLFLHRLGKNVARALDIGCGNGAYMEKIHTRFPDIELTGVEIDEDMYRQALGRQNRKLAFVRGSYERLDGTAPYDAVLARLVVPHIRDLTQWARWLRAHTHERSIVIVIDFDDRRYREDERLPLFSAMYKQSRQALRRTGFLTLPDALRVEMRQAGFVHCEAKTYAVRVEGPQRKSLFGAYMRHATEYLLDSPISAERERELSAWTGHPETALDIPMFGMTFAVDRGAL